MAGLLGAAWCGDSPGLVSEACLSRCLINLSGNNIPLTLGKPAEAGCHSTARCGFVTCRRETSVATHFGSSEPRVSAVSVRSSPSAGFCSATGGGSSEALPGRKAGTHRPLGSFRLSRTDLTSFPPFLGGPSQLLGLGQAASMSGFQVRVGSGEK